jgi:hypothetical protein
MASRARLLSAAHVPAVPEINGRFRLAREQRFVVHLARWSWEPNLRGTHHAGPTRPPRSSAKAARWPSAPGVWTA